MKQAAIVSTARTPMARYRGDFAAHTVPQLGAIALRAAVDKISLDPARIHEVIFGNLYGADWGNPARLCSLEAGFPDQIPAITVDRQCASSLCAIALAAAMIGTGMADTVVAGGVESYSQQPYYLPQPPTAYPASMEFTHYKSSIPGGRGDDTPMIQTAENLAKLYGITREDCDRFALRSHQNAAAAWAAGFFVDQVVPVEVTRKKGAPLRVETDACVRPETSLEALAQLRSIYPGGVVTAGNASPMNDGSTALVVMREDLARAEGYEILALVGASAAAGCDPALMGIGPVHSTRKLMDRAGYSLDDFDLIELNEAFAAQSLACIRELDLNPDRVNVEGGAIAIGHPNGASGGMLAARMVYALRRRDLHRGLITFCCGGGQGFSLVLERP